MSNLLVNALDFDVISGFPNVMNPGSVWFGNDGNLRTTIDGITENIIASQDFVSGVMGGSNVVSVSKTNVSGQFTSIKLAVDSISDNSSGNPYLVSVGPGLFVEDTITLKPYVYIDGGGSDATIIQVDSPAKNAIVLADNSGIRNVAIGGATNSGQAAILYNSSTSVSSDFSFVEDVHFLDNWALVNNISSSPSLVLINNAKFGGEYVFKKGFIAAHPSAATRISLRNSTTAAGIRTDNPPIRVVEGKGPNTQVILNGVQIRSSSVVSSHGIHIEDGSRARINSVNIVNFHVGVHIASGSPLGSSVSAVGLNLEGCIEDFLVEDPQASGSVLGLINKNNSTINSDSSVYIYGTDRNIVTVAKLGSDFSSVKNAIDSITDASSTNRYQVLVGPGVYSEPEIVIPSYVTLTGSSIQTTIIEPAGNHNIINASANNEIAFLTLRNAPSGYAGIVYDNIGSYGLAHKVSLIDCHTAIKYTTNSVDSFIYLEYVDVQGSYKNAFVIESQSGSLAYCNAENFYTAPVSGNTDVNIIVSGSAAQLDLQAFGLAGTNNVDDGVFVRDGARFSALGGYFRDLNRAVFTNSGEIATEINLNGVEFNNCITDIDIQNSGTTGNFTGDYNINKFFINFDSPFYITGKDLQIVTVAKRGGDFLTISGALNFITNNSSTNPYLIRIGPGVYEETNLQMKPYVYIEGNGDQSTIIKSTDVYSTIITSNFGNCGISNLQLTGSVSGQAVYATGDGSLVPFLIDSVIFGNNHTQVNVFGSSGITIVQIDDCRLGGLFNWTEGFKVTSNSGVATQLALTNLIIQDVVPPIASGALFYASGPDTALIIDAALVRMAAPFGPGIVLENGAQARISDISLRNFTKGIWLPNVGQGPFIRAIGVSLETNTNDIQIDHPSATGTIQGVADYDSCVIASSGVVLTFSDPFDGTFVNTGRFVFGDDFNKATDVTEIITSASTMGLMNGGLIEYISGLVISVQSGFGYLAKNPLPDVDIERISFSSGQLTLPDNQSNYIYINSNSLLVFSSSRPSSVSNIILGRVSTLSGSVAFIERSPLAADNLGNKYDLQFRKTVGSIFASGGNVTENGTRGLSITAGEYFYGANQYIFSGGVFNFDAYYHDGAFTKEAQSQVSNTQYDFNQSGLISIPSGHYVKHDLYTIGNEQKFMLVYGQSSNSGIAEARDASPTPPSSFTDAVVKLAGIIVQEGQTNIIEIIDERPRLGFSSTGGSSSASDHGNLTGLTDDDHPQYLLTSGARALTGNLDLGANNITNVSQVDGVDVSDHAARHLPNGSDPITTAAPATNLSATTSNAEGIQNSFARSDHSHAITTGAPSTQIPAQANAIGTSASIARADHVHNIPVGTPSGIAYANQEGVAALFARSDHIHAHGNLSGGLLHDVATQSAAGFMSASDKTNLDNHLVNSGNPHNTSLSGLIDTLITGPASGDILGYTDTWINRSLTDIKNELNLQKSDLPSTIAYEDEQNTFTQPQTFNNFINILKTEDSGNPSVDTIRLFAADQFGRTVLQYRNQLGFVIQLAQDNLLVVRNETGSPIGAFTPVYESGIAITGESLVAAANASDANTMPAIGVTIETIANNSNGFILLNGIIKNIDTSIFTIGQELYVSTTPGIPAFVPPAHPNLRQRIGRIISSNATSGQAMIYTDSLKGDHIGTNQNQWLVGNNLAGSKDVVFRNSADLILRASHTSGYVVNLPASPGTLALLSDISSPSGSAQTQIQFKDQGVNVGVSGGIDAVNFIGTGIVASASGTAINVEVNAPTGAVGITVGDGQNVITTGFKGYVTCPYAGVITGWYLTADNTGSIEIDVWKNSFANFPPGVGDSITGTEKPTLSAAQNTSDTNLTTWNTTVNGGDVFGFNVDSVSAVTRITLVISIRKS